MSGINVTDQFNTVKSLLIQQKQTTTDFCLCCWTVNGRYYDIYPGDSSSNGSPSTPKNKVVSKNNCILRADEDLKGSSVHIKDTDGLMFLQLVGHAMCQCGCCSAPHSRIDVHCTPGQMVGTIHYASPSNMFIKDLKGELVYYVKCDNLSISSFSSSESLKNKDEAVLQVDGPKFRIFTTNEDQELVATITRKRRENFKKSGEGSGYDALVTFEKSDLDFSSKTMIFGAAFPIGIECFESNG